MFFRKEQFQVVGNLNTRLSKSAITSHCKMLNITKLTKFVDSNRVLLDFQRTLRTLVKKETDDVPDEKESRTEEFRILQILPQKETEKSGSMETQKVEQARPISDTQYSENVDWTNVWVGPKTFDPFMVPLPLRQGYVKNRSVPEKYANAELMKIPNFLHLTPPAIKKHCEVLKKFCTKWPEKLKTEQDMKKHFPITVIASDYCHSSPSIRNPLSRIVILKFNIDCLELDKHAKDKFLRLVGNRYNPETGNIFLTAKNCPLKKQNYDHAMFILTALCFESWRVEEWEKLKSVDDLEEYCFDLRKTKANMEAYFDYTGMPHAPMKKISNILEEYIGGKEEPHLINSLKEEMVKILNLPKFN